MSESEQITPARQPRTLYELCWSVLLDRAPLDGYVCGAACYQLPFRLLVPLCRTVLDAVRVKNSVFYSCQTVGHLSVGIRRTAQQKARQNETILAAFLRHWPQELLVLQQVQGLHGLTFLQEGHPERDCWSVMEMEECDLFVQRYGGKRVQENKKEVLSAACSLLRTFLKLQEEGGCRRLRHLDISARPLSWVELFALVGMVWDAAPVSAGPPGSVSLGLRMKLSESRRMYARRLLESGLAGPVGAARVVLRRVAVISSGPDPEEHRQNLVLAGQVLAALRPAAVTSLSVQVDGAVPPAWLAGLVRQLPALRELKLLLPAGAQPEPDDWPALAELLSEQRALRRLELRWPLRRRLGQLLAELPGPLSALCLPGCQLAAADLEALSLWPHLAHLEVLDLSEGVEAAPLAAQDAAVQHLCVLLAQCERLRALLLDGCRVPADQLPALLRTVRTRDSLERLSLVGCGDPEQPDELLRLVADVVTLPRLRLLALDGFCREQLVELRQDMSYWRLVTGSGSSPYVELRQRRREGDWPPAEIADRHSD
ncbi:uncharacterized protein LOC122382170 [Amphibalanus amphitrite]|uniref:uncharacterized protein LOC122382170 n=1 Tax=Amphibalanus amphitrite TaxID=1232801 RepID=UPI001C91C521|nr:uncharacterized protein LOC122382170 [Amphibalanus amphitrite]XP_043223094.1 uncharacterized protein LOC122382170 [Amphibalanus amphitrite]